MGKFIFFNMGVKLMDNKKQVEVVIGGKVYKLAGNESADYIQSISRYLDRKLAELNSKTSSSVIYSESFPILLALNIADDLFKSRSEKGIESEKLNAKDSTLVDDLNKKIVEQAKQIEELNTKIAEKENEASTLNQHLEHKSGEGANLYEQLKSATNQITELNKKLSKKNQDLITSTKKVSDKTLAINELNKQIIDRDTNIADLNKKISEKNKELEQLSQKLAEKNTTLNELNQKGAEKNQKLNSVNKERDDLAVKLKTSTKKTEELEEQLTQLNSELSLLKADIEKERVHFNKNKPTGSEADLMATIDSLRAENKQLDKEKTILELELSKAKTELKDFLQSFE